MVYGVTGSGKTTLARQIGEATGLPWHSVDDEIGWLPGWVMRSPEEQRRLAQEICGGQEWVLDTAYGTWLDVPLESLDMIVALDYPRWFSLQRLLRRTVSRATTRQEMCNGNTESWRQAFSKDSIVVWHFRSWSRKRSRIRQWVADPSSVRPESAPGLSGGADLSEGGGPSDGARLSDGAGRRPTVLHFRSARAAKAWCDSLSPG